MSGTGSSGKRNAPGELGELGQAFAIRGARMLHNGNLVRRDLLIRGEKILEVSESVDSSVPTLDGSGLVALPGAIDAHVHFREPGATQKEDWSSGSRAAAAGGVTTVLEMPNTDPPTTSLKALREKRRVAASSSLVDYGLYFGLTDGNLEEALAAEGIAGIKVFLGASTGGLVVMSEAVLEKVFRHARSPIVVHAEDERLMRQEISRRGGRLEAMAHGAIRCVGVAVAALEKALDLAARTAAHLHVAHTSSGTEAAMIRRARAAGVRVTCEASPHHLLLDESFVEQRGCLGKVNPPLRSRGEREGLFEALKEGTIDMVATDHAPHLLEEKRLPYERAPAGLPSVELFLPLLLELVAQGRLSLADVVRLSATGPAAVFGIAEKGRLEAGSDADLALVDLELERRVDPGSLKSRCGWSPYAGWNLRGWPVMTFVRGKLVWSMERGWRPEKGMEVSFAPVRGRRKSSPYRQMPGAV